jgi:hypothetical protein
MKNKKTKKREPKWQNMKEIVIKKSKKTTIKFN